MSRLCLSNNFVQAVSLYSDSEKYSRLCSQPSKHGKIIRSSSANEKTYNLIVYNRGTKRGLHQDLQQKIGEWSICLAAVESHHIEKCTGCP